MTIFDKLINYTKKVLDIFQNNKINKTQISDNYDLNKFNIFDSEVYFDEMKKITIDKKYR